VRGKKKGHGKKEKRDKDVFRMCWNLKFREGKDGGRGGVTGTEEGGESENRR
jgi:hypothetical protein